MDNVITLGKRLIPREHIALVELYDAAANPKFHTSREYKGRVVLINRDSILTEDTPQAFAATHGFRFLMTDQIATNPALLFRVETFAPTDGFASTKPYVTRLLWRDQDGNDQSKLLLAPPETVLAVVLRGEEGESSSKPRAATSDVDEASRRPPRGRRTAGSTGDVAPRQ